MKLRTEWRAIRTRIGAVLHATKLGNAPDFAHSEYDNREWVVIYRTADGFCCMYMGLPVEFEDMLDVEMWTEEMDVRAYFIGM